ncbi:MAG: tRNA lysidine(34) synthetase TilS, partial [Planctomycetota bacterium]|nr:tRNA lysidine(34) synthetase TilS [Planctomycetota bacterium]
MLLQPFTTSLEALLQSAQSADPAGVTASPATLVAPSLLIIALSGGLDSVTLLDLSQRWREENPDRPPLLAAHLDHGIRGSASREDREFCQALAAARGVKFVSQEVDIPSLARENHLGLEEAGRLARQRFFADLAGCQPTWVLTGHHADDQAETILMHLRRGTHRRGLSGMLPLASSPLPDGRRITVARPLLEIPRSAILAHAQLNHLSWREDESNLDTAFQRNRIRHQTIPALEAILPGFRDRLLAKAKTLRTVETRLTRAGRELVEKLAWREKDGLLFRLEAEAFLDPERLLYAFRHLLEEEMGARLPYGAVLSRLAELAKSGGMGESLSLPGRLQARKEA